MSRKPCIFKQVIRAMAVMGVTALSTGVAVAKDNAGTFPGIYPIAHNKAASVGMQYIQSIQQSSVTIGSGNTTGTATISSVSTSNAVLIFDGLTTTSTAPNTGMAYITLTDATTVTATRNSSGANTVTVNFTVLEFKSTYVNVSAQYGTIAMTAGTGSNTATITSVTTSRAPVFYLGMITSQTVSSVSAWGTIALTAATTVTSTRNGTGGTFTAAFCVIELTTTIVNNVQHRSVTLNTTSTSPTDTITSVTTSNTILLYGGVNAGTGAPNSIMHHLTLTNSTTVTLPRSGASSSTRIIKYCVLEFVSGVMASRQESTTVLASVASNTTTITSVTTTKAIIVASNFLTDSTGTANYDAQQPSVTLTDATTVTANKNTAGTISVTAAWQVVEFA